MASFLDSLLGMNSAGNTAAATQTALGGLSATAGQNRNILRGTTDKANAALNAGAAGATSALNAGYGAARGDLLDYSGRAQGALTSGANNAVSTVLGGNAGYQPFLSSGQGANSMLDNALGLGGAAGHDAATGAFRASPGYGYQVDQATDAVARKASALGMAGSGNTLSAITTLAGNMADQDYGSWLDRLTAGANRGLTAASGISGNNTAAGNIQYGAGTNLASLLQGTGSGLAGLDTSKGTALANVSTGLGNALSGNLTGLGQGITQSNLGTSLTGANLGVQGAMAQDQAQNANNGVLSNLLGSGLSTGLTAWLNPSGLGTAKKM